MTPKIIRTLAELRMIVAGWKAAEDSVGVVPTMGALHQNNSTTLQITKTIRVRKKTMRAN